jgi:uroporphyrinogen-III synthase
LFSPPGTHPAYCVGDETTRTARKYGWAAKKVGNTSAELVAALKNFLDLGPMLHISGVHTRGNITGHLNTAGIAAQHVAVYDQELCELSEYALNSLRRGIEPIIPLFSPRTARQFAKQGGITVPPHLVAISETVMKETNGIAATTRTVSDLPNASAMEETLRDVIERLEA